jgi:hypothetical protein
MAYRILRRTERSHGYLFHMPGNTSSGSILEHNSTQNQYSYTINYFSLGNPQHQNPKRINDFIQPRAMRFIQAYMFQIFETNHLGVSYNGLDAILEQDLLKRFRIYQFQNF